MHIVCLIIIYVEGGKNDSLNEWKVEWWMKEVLIEWVNEREGEGGGREGVSESME